MRVKAGLIGSCCSFALLFGLLVAPAGAVETQKKKGAASALRGAGKELVEDAKAAGTELERDASDVGGDAWRKTREVSAAAAEEVRRATREFWRDVIEEKERLLQALRRENRELRNRQAR